MNQAAAAPARGLDGKLSAEALATLDRRWRFAYLLLAPHRLGFLLAMVLLVAAGGWWALVQFDRMSAALGLAYALSPSLVHGAVMTFGFIPLFFSGFLFTAGPKWLGVPAHDMGRVTAPAGDCRATAGLCRLDGDDAAVLATDPAQPHGRPRPRADDWRGLHRGVREPGWAGAWPVV